jgi:hypothetical protein
MVDILIGVDLGQFSSFAAACVLRRTALHDRGGRPERTWTSATLCRFDALALKRYPLGTAYTDIVAHVVGQARRPELWADRPPRICLDGTGVGAAVAEMFRTALVPHPMIKCWSVVITAGRAVNQAGPRSINVAKVELAGTIRAVLESSRLRVPAELEFADALRRELGDFTASATPAGNATFEAGAGQYDDLVMALALPIYLSTWLESRQVPVLAGPGTPAFPDGYRPGSASRAVTMGGIVEFRGQLLGRDRSDWRRRPGASPYRR